jgi:hypothetical protein
MTPEQREVADSDTEEQMETAAPEDKDTSGSDLSAKPWDPKDIRITTKTFTVRETYSQIEEGELDLAPDFQRSFVWEDKRQVRLIESILLGIPLPAFYFNQDLTGAHQVIDGVQRLTTIKHFMSDSLTLIEDHLEYLKSLQGQRYSTLDPATRRRFGGTQIVAHVIEPQTPDDVKYDIFNRVNTGGSPLEAQEIRHCMSKTASREFLRSLVESPSFDKAMGKYFWTNDISGKLARDNKRMLDRELALRFCAFYTSNLSEYASAPSLDAFLLQFTRHIDQPSRPGAPKIDLVKLKAAFERAMENCHLVLGVGAFRRWQLGGRRGPLNRAVFESQAIALADYDTDAVARHRDAIHDALRKLFDDPFYSDAVSRSTGSHFNVKKRIELPREILSGIIR